MPLETNRLGRRVQFDERSRSFPVSAILAPQPPRSYNWPVDAVLDQGPDGSCVGFAFAHNLLARKQVIPSFGAAKFAFEKVYWEAQKIDPWSGGAYPGAIPFYEGTSVLAGAKTLKSAGFLSEYRWAFSLDEMILAVGYGGPCIIGINWYSGMFDPDQWGRLHITGFVAGGHAILVHGIDMATRHFTLVNSWGPSWGFCGTCEISFTDMQRLLDEQGEVCCVTRA